MDTRTIAWMCLGFLVGGGVVSIIAFVASKFRSLRTDLSAAEHQLYEELLRRDKELETVARDIREEVSIHVRDFNDGISEANREFRRRDDENERLMCQRLDNLLSEIDSRFDKHMAKFHAITITK
jgi:hypothetical protein